jgi:hypothetical protein
MLWRYHDDIDIRKFIYYYMYLQSRYRRYRQCCDDIVSISTFDFLYTPICTASVDIVDIDNVMMISCRYRHFISYTPFTCTYSVDIVDIDNVVTISFRYRHLISYEYMPTYVPLVSISSISTMLLRYRVDIDIRSLHVRTLSISSILTILLRHRVDIDNWILYILTCDCTVSISWSFLTPFRVIWNPTRVNLRLW